MMRFEQIWQNLLEDLASNVKNIVSDLGSCN
jgi:hypothetical protein